jgi:hypothetical protein
MYEVNERTTMILTVAFFDEDNVAVVPVSSKYRIDDTGSGTAIVGSTTMTPLGTTYALTITEEQNYIVGISHLYETRRVTVDFRYGAGSAKRGTNEYIYKVKNLFGVGTSASSSASASAS